MSPAGFAKVFSCNSTYPSGNAHGYHWSDGYRPSFEYAQYPCHISAAPQYPKQVVVKHEDKRNKEEYVIDNPEY